MRESVNFLFVIDVSGSMYGQKIASVNASIAECIAELKQIGASGQYDIKISVVAFADRMKIHKLNEKTDQIGAVHVKVEPHEDELYPITSFGCLYIGLKYLIENNIITDEKQGKNTFIFLFSDATPVDEKEYNAAYEAIQDCAAYKNATKYVGYAEDESDMYNRDTVRFVDYKADHIVRASEMSGEIGKLQMAFFPDFTSQSDNAKYDQIFT